MLLIIYRFILILILGLKVLDFNFDLDGFKVISLKIIISDLWWRGVV